MNYAAPITGEKPLWRRIVDFPLVAMVIAVIVVMVALTLGYLVALIVPPIRGFTFEMKLEIVSIPILLLLYELMIRHLGEHPRDDFRDPRALRNLGLGLAAGFLIFSAAVAVAGLLGVYRITGEGDLTGLLPAFITSAFFPAISEELLFRGVLFRWIEEFGGSWAALILSSILFGAAHAQNPGSSVVATSFIAIEAGLLLGGAYMLTRSLWFPMGIHAAWNFTQGEVYDIPVSGTNVHGMLNARLSGAPLVTGGSFGLEASIITLVVASAAGIWIIFLAVRSGELVKPWWVRRRLSASPTPA